MEEILCENGEYVTYILELESKLRLKNNKIKALQCENKSLAETARNSIVTKNSRITALQSENKSLKLIAEASRHSIYLKNNEINKIQIENKILVDEFTGKNDTISWLWKQFNTEKKILQKYEEQTNTIQRTYEDLSTIRQRGDREREAKLDQIKKMQKK